MSLIPGQFVRWTQTRRSSIFDLGAEATKVNAFVRFLGVFEDSPVIETADGDKLFVSFNDLEVVEPIGVPS